MANVISISGKSGSGKSTSIKHLDPKSTFVIAVTKKDLPFKGASRKYTSYIKDKKNGNHITIHKAIDIIKVLKLIHATRPEIKVVVIDDVQYIMGKQAMARAKEKDWDKHTQIAADYSSVIETALALREDLFIFTLTHIDEEVDKNGNVISAKIKTLGKMLDNTITVDGLYTWNLYSTVLVDTDNDGNEKSYYVFQTNDPTNVTTCKTPAGAFEDLYVPNNLKLVVEAIESFKNAEEDEDESDVEIPAHLNRKFKKTEEVKEETEEISEYNEESDLELEEEVEIEL